MMIYLIFIFFFHEEQLQSNNIVVVELIDVLARLALAHQTMMNDMMKDADNVERREESERMPSLNFFSNVSSSCTSAT